MINLVNLLQFAKAQGTAIVGGPGGNCGFCAFSSLGQFVTTLLPVAFGLAGVLLVLYILWGGFKWLTSGGDKEKINSAQQTIIHTIYGLVILVVIFILFRYIPQFFGSAFNIIP